MRSAILALIGLSAMALAGCAERGQQWEYERTEDKLRDFTEVVATLDSNEWLVVGETRYRRTFVVKRSHGQPDKGYFPLMSCVPDAPLLMRLDDGPIETIPCVRHEDAVLRHSEIDQETIRRIENATTMFVEIPYSDGPTRISYNVAGLTL